jgi:hypothetical protein
MPHVEFDEEQFPLVVVTPIGPLDFSTFEVYLAQLDAWLVRGQRFAMVLDTRRSAPLPAVLRRRHAEWMAARKAALERWCAGGAIAITDPLIRGTLTAILWVQPLPFRHQVVKTREEGEEWCRTQLAAPL